MDELGLDIRYKKIKDFDQLKEAHILLSKLKWIWLNMYLIY